MGQVESSFSMLEKQDDGTLPGETINVQGATEFLNHFLKPLSFVAETSVSTTSMLSDDTRESLYTRLLQPKDLEVLTEIRLPSQYPLNEVEDFVYQKLSSKLIAGLSLNTAVFPRLLRSLCSYLRETREIIAMPQPYPEVTDALKRSLQTLMHISELSRFLIKHASCALDPEEMLFQLSSVSLYAHVNMALGGSDISVSEDAASNVLCWIATHDPVAIFHPTFDTETLSVEHLHRSLTQQLVTQNQENVAELLRDTAYVIRDMDTGRYLKDSFLQFMPSAQPGRQPCKKKISVALLPADNLYSARHSTVELSQLFLESVHLMLAVKDNFYGQLGPVVAQIYISLKQLLLNLLTISTTTTGHWTCLVDPQPANGKAAGMVNVLSSGTRVFFFGSESKMSLYQPAVFSPLITVLRSAQENLDTRTTTDFVIHLLHLNLVEEQARFPSSVSRSLNATSTALLGSLMYEPYSFLKKEAKNAVPVNPFSVALASVKHSRGIAKDKGVLESYYSTFDFDRLLNSVSRPSRLADRQLGSLLIYTLLYRNSTFRALCAGQCDEQQSQQFIVALLRALIIVAESHPLQPTEEKPNAFNTSDNSIVTLLLLSILILTREPQYSSTIFSWVLPAVPVWITKGSSWCQRLTTQPSSVLHISRGPWTVGGLLIATLLRIIAWNAQTYQDVFLDEIVGGILTNIAPSTQGIHWVIAEKVMAYITCLIRQLSLKLPSLVTLCLPLWCPFENDIVLPFEYLHSDIQQRIVKREIEASEWTEDAKKPRRAVQLYKLREGLQNNTHHSLETAVSKNAQCATPPLTMEGSTVLLRSLLSFLYIALTSTDSVLTVPVEATSVSASSQTCQVLSSPLPCERSQLRDTSALIYAFLRSEDLITSSTKLLTSIKYILGQSHDYETRVNGYIRTYKTQYRLYSQFIDASLRNNEDLKTSLLSQLPSGVDQFPSQTLPELLPPPTLPSYTVDTYCTSRFLVTTATELYPLVEFFLVLHHRLSTEAERLTDGEWESFDAVGLQQLSKLCTILTTSDESSEGSIKSEIGIHASTCNTISRHSSIPMTFKAYHRPYTYEETHESFRYFQSVIRNAALL